MVSESQNAYKMRNLIGNNIFQAKVSEEVGHLRLMTPHSGLRLDSAVAGVPLGQTTSGGTLLVRFGAGAKPVVARPQTSRKIMK